MFESEMKVGVSMKTAELCFEMWGAWQTGLNCDLPEEREQSSAIIRRALIEARENPRQQAKILSGLKKELGAFSKLLLAKADNQNWNATLRGQLVPLLPDGAIIGREQPEIPASANIPNMAPGFGGHRTDDDPPAGVFVFIQAERCLYSFADPTQGIPGAFDVVKARSTVEWQLAFHLWAEGKPACDFRHPELGTRWTTQRRRIAILKRMCSMMGQRPPETIAESVSVAMRRRPEGNSAA